MTHPPGDVTRFVLMTEDELAALPLPAWLIDGVLPSGALAVLVGERSSYKSFLALDWAAHVALGYEWHGRHVQPGTVVYIWAEGRSGIHPRLEAWKQFNTYQHPVDVLFLPQSVAVNQPGDTADLLAAIRSRAPGGVTLIVVDTLNRNFVGNENSTEDMTAFIRGCDRLREATGATVLVVHHKGHGEADRGRGSSALDGAADTIILVARDNERIELTCSKQKDAPEFSTLALERVLVASSLALKPSGVHEGKLDGQRRLCLRVLHENYTAETGATYKAWLDSGGLKPSSFNKAREWLRANSYVASSGGKWHVTDAGRLALGAVTPPNSTLAPPLHSGAGSTTSTPLRGGLQRPPGGVVDETAAA